MKRACGQCGYDLVGLEGAVCPECGAPVREPQPPRRRLSKTAKRLMLVAAALLLLLTLFPAIPSIHDQTSELDINSGQERINHTVLWFWTYTTPKTSAFSTFSLSQLAPAGPPRWRSYHYKGFASSLRKDFRAGKLKMSLLHFENATQLAPAVPPAELKRLGQVVLDELAAERMTWTMPTEDGGIEVLDEDQKPLAEWHPTKKQAD